MKKETWVVVIDGECYGFFSRYERAMEWGQKEFPIAYAQRRVMAHLFISVGA